MTATLSALAPVFGLIVLGAVLRPIGPIGEDGWRALEQITYWLLLPALLVLKLGGTDLSDYEIGPMVTAMAGAVLIVTAFLVAIRRATGIGAAAYTSVIQGAIRQNTYIGIAAAGPLYGPDGVALAAVGIAAVIPLGNVLAVWFLTRMIGDTPAGLGVVAKSMVRNPIIVACAVGIALNAGGIGLHPLLADGLDLLARGALALGLLAVGAGLRWTAIRSGWTALLLSNLLKLVAVPALTLALAGPLGLSGVALQVAVLFNALPSSASTYVFARALGGDHALMAAILTTQVAMAAVTLPLFIALVG
ncbi:MAG: AEC family transporter [Thalassobaculum sp.]|uniref:AEC family transporter n=1 Tax=Thalassobaculum sp. TaxID=2022740 RepID=UPI0032EE0E19